MGCGYAAHVDLWAGGVAFRSMLAILKISHLLHNHNVLPPAHRAHNRLNNAPRYSHTHNPGGGDKTTIIMMIIGLMSLLSGHIPFRGGKLFHDHCGKLFD